MSCLGPESQKGPTSHGGPAFLGKRGRGLNLLQKCSILWDDCANLTSPIDCFLKSEWTFHRGFWGFWRRESFTKNRNTKTRGIIPPTFPTEKPTVGREQSSTACHTERRRRATSGGGGPRVTANRDREPTVARGSSLRVSPYAKAPPWRSTPFGGCAMPYGAKADGDGVFFWSIWFHLIAF